MKKLAAVVALLVLPVSASAQVFHYVSPVRVRIAPPALRMETVPVAPSPRHQWVAGYWGWRGGAHQWLGGHWALPPASGYIWEPAQWENQGGQWVFYDGHWRSSEVADPGTVYQPPPPPVQEVVVDTPPPAPIEEIRPVAPFENALWMPGYWHWAGARHVWVAGRWSARPDGYNWEPHRWERRDDGKWAYRHGHWHR